MNVRNTLAVGLLCIVAAGALTSASHLQVLWPFGFVPSFEAVCGDSDIAREVGIAALTFLGGGVMFAWGSRDFWRTKNLRHGGLRAFAGFAMMVRASAHFSPLFVPAVPTIFYHSPTGFTVASIAAGEAVFQQNCVVCHGAEGKGDGPAAHALPVPPADLTAAHLWMHPDGQLFWWVSHGMEAPEGGRAMPGFAAKLSEEARWDVIDFVRAHNAGLAYQAQGAWPVPLQAPDFYVSCAGAQKPFLALRGKPVRLVFGASPSDLTTVIVGSGAAAERTACTSHNPDIAASYAVVTGQKGGAVLVDAQGLLRQAAPSATALDPGAAKTPMPEAASTKMPMNAKM